MEEKPTFQHPQSQSNEPAKGQISGVDSIQETEISNLSENVSQIQNTRTNLNTDIIGLFETVTVAPTLIPVGPYDQIKISVIAGTTALNIYDSVNHVWKKVTLT